MTRLTSVPQGALKALAFIAFLILPNIALAGDITAAFSDDATEDTVGIFIQVNHFIAQAPAEYDEAQAILLMRPLRVQGDRDPKVEWTLQAEGQVKVFDTFGREISLPVSFPSRGLPRNVYLSATETGEGQVQLLRNGRLDDEIRVRIGDNPGLAGQEIFPQTFPYFEYPKAINENAVVQAAIDPVRHAERLGLSYDVYVVDHRTPEQWALDTQLIDVSGVIETAMVSGDSIQDNITAAWAQNLQGDGGLELGVPYDLVFDFGRDGKLNPGDIIDGLDPNEAGFYVVEDLTEVGPLATDSFEFDDPGLFFTEGFDGGSTRSMRSRGLVVHPSPLPPGRLPLVTFSHGNTGIQTSYLGYRYLQELLASYGFITASFDMFPAHVSLGIRWRGWLTNKNTERLILQTELTDENGKPYPPMGNGILDGKVDGERIITVGHSRGGEGVIIQYQQHLNPDTPRIRPPNGTLQGFGPKSFLGVVPIAQVNFIRAEGGSRLDEADMLIFFGSSDNDVCCHPPRHFGRCDGDKMMTYLYGAGHGYFNELWACTCAGPNLMSRPEVEAITKAYLLSFCMMQTYGNVPAKDYFTRSPNAFRPLGTEFVRENRQIVNLYRDALAKGNFVIEDFETNTDDNFLSSSGQPVMFDVQDIFEGYQFDSAPGGGWRKTEPDGGFWWENNGAIFNWNGNGFHYSQTIAPEERDLSDDAYLAFMICQQSNHPETIGLNGDRDITVTLVDGDGGRASINTLPFGGIDDPYLRTNGGWGQSLSSYRLRFADFETDGTGINLKNVVEIRFEFGAMFGSDRGRVGIDDIEIVRR